MKKKTDVHSKWIVISGEKRGLPYSKGLMASSMMATGLSPARAYHVASLIEERLRERNSFVIDKDELRAMTHEALIEHAGKDYADRYLRWRALGKLDKPLIILIGGTTGVGKSTITSEIAHRLGITRIVSTDALREVMRAIFSEDLMPALYESSFNAWKKIRMPFLPSSVDPVTVGFREQTNAVAVGVKAVIERAIKEGLSMVLEGVHIVPGYIESDLFKDALLAQFVITVEDEDLHRSHFYIRELETEGFRPFEKYRANFESIRKIGAYIEQLACEKKVPIISSHSLDSTVNDVLEEITKQVLIFPEVLAKSKAVRVTSKIPKNNDSVQ